MHDLKSHPDQTNPDTLPWVLVLGLGNILQGDDGLGVRAAELLAERDLPEGVVVEDGGTPGIGLVNRIEEWDFVILIDAVQMGSAPGNWRRFTPAEVTLIASADEMSVHQADLASALKLAEAVKKLPKKVIIYGIEPEKIGWGEELSATVQSTLPIVVDQIQAELWKREA